MYLIRLAVIKCSQHPEEWAGHWQITTGRVRIWPLLMEQKEGNTFFLVGAKVKVPLPKVNDDGEVEIPNRERRLCEEAIEFAANAMSIQQRCHRRITSPNPAVVFEVENDEEMSFLNSCMPPKLGFGIKGVYPYAKPKDFKIFNDLSDRPGGISLMAEAINQDSPSGKYRDFMRLFENAFALAPSDQLVKKLYQFLNPKMGYTRSEIRSWIQRRDGISHGDLKKSSRILLESDVRLIVGRMEQAAYDVLLNKSDWRSASRARKERWSPAAVSTGLHSNATVSPGASVTITLLDAFEVFGSDNFAFYKEGFPKQWWPVPKSSVPKQETGSEGHSKEIRMMK